MITGYVVQVTRHFFSHLVFISHRLIDVDSILLVAIVSPTIFPITLLRPSIGEPEELRVGGITTQRHHFLKSRVLPEKINMKFEIK